MKALRFLLKVLLLPITILLTLLVFVGRLLTNMSAVLLCIVAFAFLLVGIASMVFLREPFSNVWQAFLLAWMLSPFGLPLHAGFLVGLLDVTNGAIKNI